jgi:hypothetical protein
LDKRKGKVDPISSSLFLRESNFSNPNDLECSYSLEEEIGERLRFEGKCG